MDNHNTYDFFVRGSPKDKDTNKSLGGNHVVSHCIQEMVEEVVMSMQSLVDPTLLL
jgi:hypothetical protein